MAVRAAKSAATAGLTTGMDEDTGSRSGESHPPENWPSTWSSPKKGRLDRSSRPLHRQSPAFAKATARRSAIQALVHPAHAAAGAAVATARGFLLLLRNLRDQSFRREQQGGDRRRVLERRAHDLHRVDDAGVDHVLVLVGAGVVAVVTLRVLDLLDDDRAFLARVGRDPAERLFDRLADDVDADLLVAFELQRVERLAGADERHAAAGDDPLFNGRLGGVHRVFDARLLFLHLGFGGRTDLDDGDAADELRQALLELLAVVVRRGLLDLRADLLHAPFDGPLRARAFDDRRVVLVDRDLLGLAQVVELDVLELEAEVFRDRTAA